MVVRLGGGGGGAVLGSTQEGMMRRVDYRGFCRGGYASVLNTCVIVPPYLM